MLLYSCMTIVSKHFNLEIAFGGLLNFVSNRPIKSVTPLFISFLLLVFNHVFTPTQKVYVGWYIVRFCQSTVSSTFRRQHASFLSDLRERFNRRRRTEVFEIRLQYLPVRPQHHKEGERSRVWLLFPASSHSVRIHVAPVLFKPDPFLPVGQQQKISQAERGGRRARWRCCVGKRGLDSRYSVYSRWARAFACCAFTWPFLCVPGKA